MNRIESYPCRVKGVTFYNEKYGNREYRQTIIDDLYHKKMLENGQLLRLKQEPDNEIDPSTCKTRRNGKILDISGFL